MKTSAAGRAAIIAREGKRLAAYRDSVGVLTIGVGHTGRMAPPKVTSGMRITDAQCDTFLAADLAPVETAIDTAVKVPMTQNEFDAMASLAFNIGVNGFKRSVVVRKLNLGDVRGAAEAFMGWSKPSVLIGRRKAERAQFLTPDSSAGGVAQTTLTQRAAKLSRSAAAARDRADTAQVASASLAVGGAATVAATHAHHPWMAVAVGGGILVVGAIAAAVAILGKRTAQTLKLNAAVQAQRATAPTAEP